MDPITIKYNNDLRLLICLGVAGWRTDKIDQTVTKMIPEKINIDPEFQSQKTYRFSCPFIMLKPLIVMHHIPNQCNGCQFIKLSKCLDQLDNLPYKSLSGLIRRDTNTARYIQPIIGNPNSLSKISFKMIKPTTKAPILNKIVTN